MNGDEHFSLIAEKYRELRNTDPSPILSISQKLLKLPSSPFKVADIGCGTGRYSFLLTESLGRALFLYCLDSNSQMLRVLNSLFEEKGLDSHQIIQSNAEALPFPDSSLDSITTFNAIHHFNLSSFSNEALRVLKKGGLLFVYTRTPQQNSNNIWGRFFPKFCLKETRLYSLTFLLNSLSPLTTVDVENFRHRRESDAGTLMKLAQSYHYSTFRFYTPEEFTRAQEGFLQSLKKNFPSLLSISWVDENLLVTVRKE